MAKRKDSLIGGETPDLEPAPVAPDPVPEFKASIPRGEFWQSLKVALKPLDGNISRAEARALVDLQFMTKPE